MARPADYHFVFQFKNPKIEAKATLYQIWVIPNKDKIEIIAGNSQYVQLEGKMQPLCFRLLQERSWLNKCIWGLQFLFWKTLSFQRK